MAAYDKSNHLTFIAVPSGDTTAIGNASNFTVQIPPISLGDPNNYVVALADITYHSPGAGTSVYVSCDLAQPVRTGSQWTNTLMRLPPSSAAGLVHWEPTSSLIHWRPLSRSEASSIQITLTDSTGALLPYSGFYTTVTLAIKRIA